MSRRAVIRRARRRAWTLTMQGVPLETAREEAAELTRAASANAADLAVPPRWRALFEREFLRAGFAAIRAFEAWS